MRYISLLSFAVQALFCLEGNSWSSLGITQTTKPGGAQVGDIQLEEHSTLNLITSSSPMVNEQYFDGDLTSKDANLKINLTIREASKEGYTPIYWRKPDLPAVLNAFICKNSQQNEGACSLDIAITPEAPIPINRLFNLEKGTLTVDQNVTLSIAPKGKVRSIFYSGTQGTLEFDGRFFVDLREQEGTFTDPKITGNRKVVIEHYGVSTTVNTYQKNFDVQIYGDIISAGQRLQLNFLTPNSIFEGHFDIGDSPIYFSQNIMRVSNQAQTKFNLTFLQSTNPAPQRFTLLLNNRSKSFLHATFDRTQYALLDLDISNASLYANLAYSQNSQGRGDKDNVRIALHNQGTWITNNSAFADEIFFNVLLPDQRGPIFPDQPKPDPLPPYPPLTPSGHGGNIDLRFSDFEHTPRNLQRINENNRITLTSKLISGDGGIFKLYGILNTGLWSKDNQGNTIATDQIITQNLEGKHFIQIYWDSQNLDENLLKEDLSGHRIVVAKQLTPNLQGDFIGSSASIGIYDYTTPLEREEIKDDQGNTTGFEWVIGKITEPTPSRATKTLNAIFSIPYKTFLSQTTTLHQRLGDLRNFNNIVGPYFKANYSLLHAKETVLAENSLSMYTDITLGADYGIYHNGGKSFLGASFNITPLQDLSLNHRFRGDSIAYGISIYGSTLFDNGIYTDILFKYALANHSYALNAEDFYTSSIQFSSQAFLGSFELGYKFRLPIPTPDFDHSFYYLKPQLNLIVGTILGNQALKIQHSDSFPINIHYKYAIPVQTGLSFDFGRRFNQERFMGDLFLTLGAQYTFNAGNPLYLQTPTNQAMFQQDDIFNLKLGIGGNILLSSGIRFYFETSSIFLGRIAPVFNLNAGMRIPLAKRQSKLPISQPVSPLIIYGDRFRH
ncbi:autotransporter outer membrane beta-barrel domain-containing protein [Helicobacter kayseriensis]|uniref:autotransporter outer membrane beta-barrel domain-containing protein n=1 Tax=Helicobacter kayseriensis TaxID=2905877 RepID=UPI001E487F9A|nr:autotransporter outer membrane beta-barrel domain-containing protein [Helicobacter kayseriensis]MCE3046593.1 autotransporter outer membrane beta-barrel domain-containing protein [Helicobacter kayseriensis]MCE3048105.1 autotransporter outer membrane beta-barrel domain-containing protein [Helicobacter kayseriensis]